MVLVGNHIHVRFLRYSAFYTPLLLTLNSKSLKSRGIKVTYDRATPDRTVEAGFADGTVQVAQSAPAVSFRGVLDGKPPVYRHFALMNNRDGFFLGARTGTPAAAAAAAAAEPGRWQWGDLVGSTALIDHFFQPLALFRTALTCQGVDKGSINILDVGSPDQIEAAFRAGQGDYVHLQGPGPQQLEEEVS
jgi:ABC-type nitrate/sulfonate/bicarbonate transport system substrate-binding protein